MCSCYSVLECYNLLSGDKGSIRSSLFTLYKVCAVHSGLCSVLRGVQYIGGISSVNWGWSSVNWRNIKSALGDIMICVGGTISGTIMISPMYS